MKESLWEFHFADKSDSEIFRKFNFADQNFHLNLKRPKYEFHWVFNQYWVILEKKKLRRFLDGFGIFWKKKKFFLIFFYSKVLYQIIFLHFQSVLMCWVLITENIINMPHTQQWFYWNSIFQGWILLKLHCLHD